MSVSDRTIRILLRERTKHKNALAAMSKAYLDMFETYTDFMLILQNHHSNGTTLTPEELKSVNARAMASTDAFRKSMRLVSEDPSEVSE